VAQRTGDHSSHACTLKASREGKKLLFWLLKDVGKKSESEIMSGCSHFTDVLQPAVAVDALVYAEIVTQKFFF